MIEHAHDSEMALRVFSTLFSAGWLLPLWISVGIYLHSLPGEAGPGSDKVIYIDSGYRAFTISVAWLTLVILFWAWRFSRPPGNSANTFSKPRT
jgi:hypothetical protein